MTIMREATCSRPRCGSAPGTSDRSGGNAACLIEGLGWDVNLHGIPHLEAFLEAALLLPASVTADFNFPEWNYHGRGPARVSAVTRG